MGAVPWESIEKYRASAFLLAGSSTIASVIVPVGISGLTDLARASGILLIGFAVIAVAVGLLGVYPPAYERVPRVAHTGALFAGVAAFAASSLIVGIGVVLLAEVGSGTNVPRLTGVFVVIALSMTGGFALGFLLFGFAVKHITTIPRSVGHLLVGGGSLLLLSAVVETLGSMYSVNTPPWTFFSILGVVAIDMLVIGYLLSKGAAQ